MCRDLFLLIIVASLTYRMAQAVAPIFCYQCSGLTCEPLPRYLETCLNSLSRTKARCYSVAWNSTNIYRGCYEPEDDYVQHCNDRRLDNCAVCEGNGCNNLPLFHENQISCKNCTKGECALWSLPRQDFRMCSPSLMTQPPSCYTILNYEMNLYTSGCTNEMSAEDSHYCSLDIYQFMCRICYTHNCNDYLIDFQPQGKRLICYSLSYNVMSGRYCDRYTYLTPFTNCMMEMDFMRPRLGQMAGCTNMMIGSESSYTMVNPNFWHCGISWCNHQESIRGAIKRNRYRPCIDPSEKYNVTFGALPDSCCITAEYKDDTDRTISFSGCETKYRCRNPKLCKRCCDDDMSYYEERKPTCNVPERRKKWTHQCYRCTGCATVTDAVQANQTYCSAPKGERHTCYTYKNETVLYRGCAYNITAATKYNTRLNSCLTDSKNCHICTGELCNDQDFRFSCYECSEKNYNCGKRPSAMQLTQCPDVDQLLTSKPSCYTKMTLVDHMYSRGCRTKNPCINDTMSCWSCFKSGCNIKKRTGSCIGCSGNEKSHCALKPHWERTILCPFVDGHPDCYTFFDSVHQTVHRGCTYQTIYTNGYKRRCENEPKSICTTCEGELCNYNTLKTVGGAARRAGSWLLFAFSYMIFVIK